MNQFISLDEAIKMTELYRREKQNILKDEYKGKDLLSISETFDGTTFLTILAKPGCKNLRIYYGMTADLKIHAIIVGVNEKNEDLLPETQSTIVTTENVLGEQGILCPPLCPPSSPLNP
jgi:hypothetical protein